MGGGYGCGREECQRITVLNSKVYPYLRVAAYDLSYEYGLSFQAFAYDQSYEWSLHFRASAYDLNMINARKFMT